MQQEIIDPSMERQIRESIDSISERIKTNDVKSQKETNTTSVELWGSIANSGFVGIGLPEEYGGGGHGLLALSIVAEQLAFNEHLPVLLVMSPGIVGSIILKSGTELQKRKYLPGIASGADRFAFAITEPSAGSNTHNIETILVEDSNGNFKLSGTKCFISGVENSDYILVVAKVKRENGQIKGPVCCVIDTSDKNLSRTKIETEKFSADYQWLLHFNEIPVPKSNVIGGVTGGLSSIFQGLNPERVLMASFCNGLGLRAIKLASQYASERSVWGSPIASHQAVSHPLAKSKIEIELARLMTTKAAAAYDSKKSAGEYANYAKFSAAEAAITAVDNAIQVHGGNGFTADFGVSRLYWPARLFRTAPVSSEMILNYVGNKVLGLPKSY